MKSATSFSLKTTLIHDQRYDNVFYGLTMEKVIMSPLVYFILYSLFLLIHNVRVVLPITVA